jgi:hypothetical protein
MSTESEVNEVETEEEAGKIFSYFDYRVILTDTGDYEIRDVYYDANGEINGWGSQANLFAGVDLEDLAGSIGYAVRAMARPLLIESELSGYLAPEDGSTLEEPAEAVPGPGETLRAIVTSSCAPTTLGEASEWAGNLERFGLSEDTNLLDGGALHIEGGESLLEYVEDARRRSTVSLGDLRGYLAHLLSLGLAPETALVDAEDLAIDLPVSQVSAIACGNCELFDVVVDVHGHSEISGD